MKNVFYFTLSLKLALFSLFPDITLAETCNRDQAFNKMMALGRAQQLRMASEQSHQQMIANADLAKETGAVGQILADGKYNEACELYNAIAEKYGIDLGAAATGMKTMADLKKDGGKGPGGTCSQADASIKLTELMESIEDLKAKGENERADALGLAYRDELQNSSELIYTNPSALCAKLLAFKKQHKLP